MSSSSPPAVSVTDTVPPGWEDIDIAGAEQFAFAAPMLALGFVVAVLVLQWYVRRSSRYRQAMERWSPYRALMLIAGHGVWSEFRWRKRQQRNHWWRRIPRGVESKGPFW